MKLITGPWADFQLMNHLSEPGSQFKNMHVNNFSKKVDLKVK